MSRKRRDPSAAKARQDRIRSDKHIRRREASMESAPEYDPPRGHSFSAERTMREVLALTEGQSFDSFEDLNARIMELTSGGRLSEKAKAWKQDDPKWRAQELAYAAMEAADPFDALRLVDEAQKLDPDCTDAQRLMVTLLPMELDNRIDLMREVVEKAERNLGMAFFEEHEGHFWGVLSTRPYMRARQELGELLAVVDRLEDAVAVYERMLELNPNDNQGVRYALLGLYLATKQAGKAGDLVSRYPGEEDHTAVFAWGRVVEHWLASRPAEAQSALVRARGVNSFVERYLRGTRKTPERLPLTYRSSDDSEAQVAATELSPALKRLPEFVVWLRQQR